MNPGKNELNILSPTPVRRELNGSLSNLPLQERTQRSRSNSWKGNKDNHQKISIYPQAIIVFFEIFIGVALLASFDKIDKVHTWWASIIILIAVWAVTTLWNGTCILWIRPLLAEISSRASTKLKENDEENSIKEMMNDNAEYEILKQMTPKPQYGVMAPEEPIQIAIRKFNKDPETGIKYIQDNNILQGTTYTSIITFLHMADELNKIKLGEYLGGNLPANKEMLQRFVDNYNFVAKELDIALREFLSKFRLPREAQQIDRIMESFAIKFHNDNPGKFTDSDTAYLLSFSIILLNTDAHNPAIKNKMPKRVFVQNCIDFRKGKRDLTTEYLEKLYDRIIHDELKLDRDSLFTNALIKGWLFKMTSDQKKWQKRWFVLKNNCLYYFTNDKDEENPKVIIPLEGLKVTKVSDTSFEIEDSAVNTIKSVKLTPEGPVEGQHHKYHFKAPSIEDANKWCDAITNNTLGSPVLLLIKKKKKMLGKLNKRSKDSSSSSSRRGYGMDDGAAVASSSSIHGGDKSPNLETPVAREFLDCDMSTSRSNVFDDMTEESSNYDDKSKQTDSEYMY
eukprot:gene12294-14412_t